MFSRYKNLRLFFAASDNCGCGWYRSKLPSKYISNVMPNVTYNYGFPSKNPILNDQDVYFLQRINHDYFIDFIPFVQKHGRKVIVDLDDDLWTIPASNGTSNNYKSKDLKRIQTILSLADAVTVSTLPLAEKVKQYSSNIHVIPNMIEDIFSEKNHNEIPVVGWAGTFTHSGDFDDKLIKYIREITVSQKAKVIFFGYTPKFLDNLVESIPFVDVQDYMSVLNNLKIDVGLIVASDNEFNKSKSNIKFLEYSAAGTVSVASNVYPYENTIHHALNGYLVKQPKVDWRDYIDYMIRNPSERNLILNSAKLTTEKFSFKHNIQTFYDAYLSLFNTLYPKGN